MIALRPSTIYRIRRAKADKKAVTNKTANDLLLDIEHLLRLVLLVVFHPI
jgi:hypothetical protein